MKRAVIRSKFLWSNAEQSKEWQPRHDVTKSRRRVNNAKVNNSATSRRHHVATSARKSASHHLMYGRLGNEGIGKRTRGGTDFQSKRIQTSRECPGFVPLSILLDII